MDDISPTRLGKREWVEKKFNTLYDTWEQSGRTYAPYVLLIFKDTKARDFNKYRKKNKVNDETIDLKLKEGVHYGQEIETKIANDHAGQAKLCLSAEHYGSDWVTTETSTEIEYQFPDLSLEIKKLKEDIVEKNIQTPDVEKIKKLEMESKELIKQLEILRQENTKLSELGNKRQDHEHSIDCGECKKMRTLGKKDFIKDPKLVLKFLNYCDEPVKPLIDECKGFIFHSDLLLKQKAVVSRFVEGLLKKVKIVCELMCQSMMEVLKQNQRDADQIHKLIKDFK